jgi:hypothetical protein
MPGALERHTSLAVTMLIIGLANDCQKQLLGYSRKERGKRCKAFSLVGLIHTELPPNGTITNDKFCLSRHVRLHLSHWRLAQRSQRGHHIKRGKTYAKAVKLVYDGGFCCKKREKRLTGIPIKASEPFHPFK